MSLIITSVPAAECVGISGVYAQTYSKASAADGTPKWITQNTYQ